MKFAINLSLLSFVILASGSAVDYETEIHPILKSRCGKCHMDGESKGKLSLDKDKIAKEIGDGCIVPGNVKKSDLHWTMTLSPDDDLAMPPKGKRVPKAEMALIAKWIEEGAKIESSGKPPAPAEPKKAPPVDSMTGGDTMGGGSMTGGDTMGGGMAGGAGATPAAKPYKGVFKNKAGMQVPATLTRVDGDRAILKLPDGKEYRYPIAMFDPETQNLVKQFQAGTLPTAK